MAKQASKTASRPAAAKRLLRRTTIAVPEELLVLADQAVREGRARSRAELLARALRREFAAQRRATVDAAFSRMADDPEYQAEALRVAEEYAAADWEAIRIAERGR